MLVLVLVLVTGATVLAFVCTEVVGWFTLVLLALETDAVEDGVSLSDLVPDTLMVVLEVSALLLLPPSAFLMVNLSDHW